MFSKNAFRACFAFAWCSDDDAIRAFPSMDCNSDPVPPSASTSPDPRSDSFALQYKTNLKKIVGLLCRAYLQTFYALWQLRQYAQKLAQWKQCQDSYLQREDFDV
ncbi:MAG: hypothetical protein EZS28_053317, partial [Streblomastix strix]